MATPDYDLKKDFDDSYDEGYYCWSTYYEEAYKDLKFSVGDQFDSREKEYLRKNSRNAYVYNYIRRVVKMIGGYQRRNRLSSVCQAIEGSDEETADIFSDLLLYVMQQQNGYNTLSNAFEGSLITGMNLISLWMDYTKDPANGDIKIGYDSYNSFILDPYFRQQDLSDCRYAIRRRYVSEDVAKSLLPDSVKEIEQISPGRLDDKFNYMTYARQNNRNNLYAYDEYWKRESKKVDLLIDGVTGENKIWRGNNEALNQFKIDYPWVKSEKIIIPTIKLNIFLQNELMFDGEDPYGLEDFPFVPVLGYWEPQCDDYSYKLQGVVRSMRDAQSELNKTRSKMVDVVQSQVNSGWIVKEGSVTNKGDLYKTGQGVVIERSMTSEIQDVSKIPPAEIPQTLFALTGQLGQDIMQIAGANEELMGVAESGNSDISGVLAKVRAANGLTTLQDLFDNLNLSQKLLGQKITTMVQRNWSPEKIQRITNKQPTEEFHNKDFGKYDIVIKETMLTDTQKQLAYAQALAARQVGVPIPDSFIIDMMPIANKSDLKEAFEQQAQAQQVEQERVAEQDQMVRELQKSKVISDLSLAAERRARMVADAGLAKERIAQAGYDRARTITEIMKTVSDLEKNKVETNDQRITNLQGMVELLREQDSLDIERSQQNALQEVLFTNQIGDQQQVPQGVDNDL